MVKYQVVFDGQEPDEDEVFDSYDEADEYGLYAESCQRQGAEILHLSNPGDYAYDEENFETSSYEIIEIEE